MDYAEKIQSEVKERAAAANAAATQDGDWESRKYNPAKYTKVYPVFVTPVGTHQIWKAEGSAQAQLESDDLSTLRFGHGFNRDGEESTVEELARFVTRTDLMEIIDDFENPKPPNCKPEYDTARKATAADASKARQAIAHLDELEAGQDVRKLGYRWACDF
jgi:hypothetical protein